MNKKEFYEAPEWVLRELRLRKSILSASDGEPDGFDENNTDDDSGSWITPGN